MLCDEAGASVELPEFPSGFALEPRAGRERNVPVCASWSCVTEAQSANAALPESHEADGNWPKQKLDHSNPSRTKMQLRRLTNMLDKADRLSELCR